MKNTRSTVHNRFFACLMVGLLSIAMAAPTFAQASKQLVMPEGSSWWEHNLGKQLATLLDSPVEANKQRGLEYCIHYGSFFSDKIDLSAAVPQLLDIYENDTEEGYRLMALSALHAIGDPESMHVLLDKIGAETSPRVRHVTQNILLRYAQEHRYLRESTYFRDTMRALPVGP